MTKPMTDDEIDELRGTGLAAPVIARLVARIDADTRALKAGPARLREMAADYDRKVLALIGNPSPNAGGAGLIRSADLINAALHVEAAQEKARES